MVRDILHISLINLEAILLEIPEVFKRLQPYIESILQDPALSGSSVLISCKTLTPEEAIGSPGRNDFPLQRAINYGSCLSCYC